MSILTRGINKIRRILKRLLFELRLKTHPPVFIYQMGKVASSSIFWSLKKQYKGLVAHEHFFEPEHYLFENERLYHYYYGDPSRPLKVITLIREPIGRNTSSFFQNFERMTGHRYGEKEVSTEELKKLYLEKIRHKTPLVWLENLKEHFDIDVYSKPFPNTGYQHYKNNQNVEVLLMRHDLPDDEKAKLVGEFVGLKGFQLENTNIGESKEYAEAYKAFKTEVRLPKEHLDMMRTSKYVTHFYSKEYFDTICEKWGE